MERRGVVEGGGGCVEGGSGVKEESRRVYGAVD